jgi:hypothetical protein
MMYVGQVAPTQPNSDIVPAQLRQNGECFDFEKFEVPHNLTQAHFLILYTNQKYFYWRIVDRKI